MLVVVRSTPVAEVAIEKVAQGWIIDAVRGKAAETKAQESFEFAGRVKQPSIRSGGRFGVIVGRQEGL